MTSFNVAESSVALPGQISGLALDNSETAAGPQMLIDGQHTTMSQNSHVDRENERTYFRELKQGQKPGSCICDYTNFPRLLNARVKNAEKANNANIGKVAPFRFRDLPAELREKCLEFSLTMPFAIEFCPEPWAFVGTAPVGRDGRKEFYEYWDMVKAHHFTKLQAFSSAARLLQVSKQVYAEAKPILYTENHFSFTNTSGWIALEWFMWKIGIRNCKFLRNITVCYPDFSILPTTNNGANHFSTSMINLRQPPLDLKNPNRPIFYPARWFDNGFSMDPVLALQNTNLLANLKLVVPVQHTLSFGCLEHFASALLDESKFKNLQITLVALRAWHEAAPLLTDGSLARSMAARHNEQLTGKERPWKVIEAVYDNMGDLTEVMALDDEGTMIDASFERL